MKAIWTIARREFANYFISPIAYIYLLTFVVLSNWFFFRGLFLMGQADLRSFFGLMPWMFLFFIPAVAMGKWAEEKRHGTLEILFTLPISEAKVVVGKFLATWGLLCAALLLTLPMAITVHVLGNLDWGPVIGGYLGLLFMGGAYLSIGLVASSLTSNQIVAFIGGVVASFFLFLLGTPLVLSGRGGWLADILGFLGLATHFESISRGVIDSRDILYYISTITFFLFLNFLIVRRNRKSRRAVPFVAPNPVATPGDGTRRLLVIHVLTLIFALGIINLLANRFPLRVDLTEGNIYTLAKGTKSILHDLDDIVTLRVYFSENLPPALLSLRREVDDLLSELKRAAGRRVQIEYRDPASSPTEEQAVAMMGIPPVEVNVVEHDRSEVAKIYLGMAVLYGDQQEILPVVERATHLEYQIAQALIKISETTLPTLGWWNPTSGQEEGSAFSLVRESLEKRYHILDMGPTSLDQLDTKKISTLLLFGPQNFQPAERKAIEDYVTSGGRLIALVDRYVLLPELRMEKHDSTLADLLMGYGVTVDPALVLDVSNAQASFTGGVVTYHLPYPYWTQVGESGFANDLSLTSGLQSLVLPWTSPLVLAASPDREIKPLAKTTSFGVLASGEEPPRLDPQSSVELLQRGEKGERVLAALISWKEPSSSLVLVVGTSRFLEDRFVKMFPSNALFFENAVDQFAHSETLIGIRSRLALSRPLSPLSHEIQSLLKYLNFSFAPIVVLLLGGGVFLFRRHQRKTLQLLYAKGDVA